MECVLTPTSGQSRAECSPDLRAGFGQHRRRFSDRSVPDGHSARLCPSVVASTAFPYFRRPHAIVPSGPLTLRPDGPGGFLRVRARGRMRKITKKCGNFAVAMLAKSPGWLAGAAARRPRRISESGSERESAADDEESAAILQSLCLQRVPAGPRALRPDGPGGFLRVEREGECGR